MGQTALMPGVRGNHPELMPALIGRGADVGASTANHDTTALLLAVDRGLAATAQRLVAAGSDPRYRDHRGRDAFSAAASIGDPALTRALGDASP